MSLLNKTPSATYKSLLKVCEGDNQELDSTLRVIEDGLGNDSALSLSSTEVGVDRLLVDSIVIDNNTISGAVMNGGSFDGT